MQKEVRKYLIIAIIIIIAIGILFLVNTKFTGNITGRAIYGVAGAPTISSVDISPPNPTPDNNLTGSISASDGEGDNITYWYSWYKDGSLNATTLIDDDLISYFPLDNDVLDYYGGNDGTNNGATPVAGKLNGSYNFDGTNDYINCGNDASLNLQNTITISSWINLDTVTPSHGYHSSIADKCGNNQNGYWFYVGNNAKLGFLTFTSGSYDAVGSVSNIPAGEWVHVVVTYNRSATNEVKLYINGELDKEGSVDVQAGSSTDNLIIGDRGSTHRLDGKIDELIIIDEVLSATEIQQLYQGGVYGLRVDSSYTSEGDEWVLGARVGDSGAWSDQTNSSSVTISSNNPPTITLVEPQNTTYNDNESLALNFTISDDNDGISNLTCWYNIDDGSNTSISNCENTTFSVSDATTHTLNIFANDTEGEEGTDSVSFTVDSLGVSVSITQPTGTKTSRTSIPLQYTSVGNNMTCWYNVKTSIGGDVISNTTLSNCANITFDVSNDGDYVLNLYANNTFGSSDSDTSSFTVDTDSGNGGGGSGGGGGTTILQPTNLSTEITANKISDIIINPGDSKKITWKVKNTGGVFLNDCKIKGIGLYSSWISFTGIKDLAAGEEHEFIFDLNVPEDVGVGKYGLGILLSCQETSKGMDFAAEVLEQKLDLEIIEVVKEEDSIKIIYSLEELSGVDQSVDLQFLLFTQDEEKILEISDSVSIESNSVKDHSINLPIDSSLEGEFKLLINLNSETYSGFVEESLILGDSSLTGFTIFGESQGADNIIAIVLILGFLVFAFFIIRHIIKSRKRKE